MLNQFISKLGEKVLAGRDISFAEAASVVELDDEALSDLFYVAERVRTAYFGREVRLCAILNAKSGRCSEDCRFCAQSSAYGTQAPVHPLVSVDVMVRAGREARRTGARSFGIVTSGRKASRAEVETVCDAVRRLRAEGIDVCASLGALAADDLRKLVEAGLYRYNHNLETSERYFPELCTTHSHRDRVGMVSTLKSAGVSVCSGGIFGIGESWRDRLDLAFALRGLEVDTIPLNFLHPVQGTPLEDAPPLAPMEILKIIALFRLIHPRREIKVAGGRELNLRDLQSWMFRVGATSAIVGNYLTTRGRSAEADLQMIRDLGLHLAPHPCGLPAS